ncbi:hypothetical protein M426DRAFT_325724 [Hypoxylon sp. CI-4A]|nr:hypothetical protein M426DRAFT_325724 [Hypoxylon sp. CI-4A]
MNSSSDRYEGYSTLEVDTDAHARNQYAETTYNAPEVNQHANKDYSYPEVNQNANKDYSYPEVVGGADATKSGGAIIDTTPPEVVHLPDSEKPPTVITEPRIWGMRRKVFWGVLIGAIILIIAIGVGVGVGVGTTKKAIEASKDEDGTTSLTDNSTQLLTNTNIATANFTDGLGNENYLVVYQLNNKAIYLSAWNSSNNQWVVSPIVDGSTNNLGLDDVRKGTALALDVFAHDDSSRDLHVYWQLPDSGGLSTIKALSYTNDKGISTKSTIPAANWVDSAAGNSYISAAGSSLVSYGKQCDLCNQYQYLYWQTSDGIREASYQNSSSGWYSDNDVIETDLTGPSVNSSMAQAHVAADTYDGHRSMNIFYRSTTGALSQIVNGDSRYIGHELGRDIGAKTTIAAYSTGFNETSDNWPEPLGFQVLTMDPVANDGIQLTYYKGSTWTAVSDEVTDLSDCKDKGTIVASHARRVYCLVAGSGNGPEIIEYEWLGDPDNTSTYSNYNKVGSVKTTID